MSDEYLNPDEEQAEAERRINQIIHGGGGQVQRRPEPMSDPLGDDYESEAVARARGRAQQTRVNLGMADEPRGRTGGGSMRATGGVVSGRTQSALMWIGGLVGVGILIVVAIIFTARAMGAGGNIGIPSLGATDTPFPTETPAVSNTPAVTRQVPNLALPPLACISQSLGGCSDYCAQPANLSECNSSRAFIEAQGVKWDVWLTCLSPGPGPNTGDAQQCMRDAWLANNP